MIVSDVETRALKLASAATGDFSTSADIIPWINDAQNIIVEATDCLVGTHTRTTTAGEDSYDLAADFWKEKRVEYNGKKAFYVEYDEYQTMVDAGTIVSSENIRYTLFNDQIIFYTSDTISDGVTITIDYYRYPTATTLSSSTIDIPDTYNKYIKFYVASQMAEENDDYELAERRISQFYTQLNEAKIQNLRIRRGPRKIKKEIYDKYSI